MNDFITTYINALKAGGVLMIPLVCLGFYLFYFGVSVCVRLFQLRSDLTKDFTLSQKTLDVDMPRRIFFLKALSGVAPLVGLLGTVIGICACISSSEGSTLTRLPGKLVFSNVNTIRSNASTVSGTTYQGASG